MSAEDLEIENVDRAERLLSNQHGSLPSGLINNISKIRQSLVLYEVDERLLTRISDVMYEITKLNDLKEVEVSVKHLSDTFWDQI